MSFITNRKQYTQINTQNSSIKQNLNIRVFQGSAMSFLLYLILSLDINQTTHEQKHKYNINEFKCNAPILEINVEQRIQFGRTYQTTS